MKLSDFFATVGPFLHGRASHAEAVRSLYGTDEGQHAVDARRLALYGRFARLHRFEVVDGIFPHLRGALVERDGKAAWERLVETYFARHPMRHFELNTNGVHLPEFLQTYARERGLPAWAVELADFEWWEWQALIAPGDGEGSGLRIASTVELRPYTFDFVDWLSTPTVQRAAEPEARESLVLFWRDADFRLRRENASPEELLVLKAVAEGLTLDAVAAASGVAHEALAETYADLVSAGILLE